MPATTAEIESLRYHLGYGNIGVGGYPYTPDGFKELFDQVVGPSITDGAETTSVTAVTAAGIAVVTPASMTGISARIVLVVDVGADEETIEVRSATSTSFVARFAKAHAEPGWPLAVESGLTRLRSLLREARRLDGEIAGTATTETAGLKSVGRGAIEWYAGGASAERVSQYIGVVNKLSSLVRVEPIRPLRSVTKLEAM
jgi:hypothetical protein